MNPGARVHRFVICSARVPRKWVDRLCWDLGRGTAEPLVYVFLAPWLPAYFTTSIQASVFFFFFFFGGGCGGRVKKSKRPKRFSGESKTSSGLGFADESSFQGSFGGAKWISSIHSSAASSIPTAKQQFAHEAQISGQVLSRTGSTLA